MQKISYFFFIFVHKTVQKRLFLTNFLDIFRGFLWYFQNIINFPWIYHFYSISLHAIIQISLYFSKIIHSIFLINLWRQIRFYIKRLSIKACEGSDFLKSPTLQSNLQSGGIFLLVEDLSKILSERPHHFWLLLSGKPS